ncbi:serine/threonine-protein kinase pim-2-like [Solea solea]|uniref:serine/threonine-protein kinase pim-2-like n=1 Tax=Solea solea TaxID=90069 RepID=UPI00272AFF6B|nr:serine/threonine-protein kinase pim-2-like [Solea solea]
MFSELNSGLNLISASKERTALESPNKRQREDSKPAEELVVKRKPPTRKKKVYGTFVHQSCKCPTASKPDDRRSCVLGHTCTGLTWSFIQEKKQDLESFRKLQRDDSRPSEVPVVKATKRKASAERETPRKKKKSDDVTQNNSCLLGHTCRDHFHDKYQQLGKIGQGGFGSVYDGIRTSDKLHVAIKHIRSSCVRRGSMMLNGIKCMIPLEVILLHKAAGEPESVGKSAAVSLLDWYDLKDRVILVMERPQPSVTLNSYLQSCGPVNEKIAKKVTKQLVEAAVKMEAVKIFHRDIKTSNILVQSTPGIFRMRVIDFGCGSILRKRHYNYRRFRGTPLYIPPEFMKYGIYQAGPTTVWQLGAVLYEVLHGVWFNTFSFVTTKCKIRSDLSTDCLDFFKACLALEPGDRATLKQMLQHPWLS